MRGKGKGLRLDSNPSNVFIVGWAAEDCPSYAETGWAGCAGPSYGQ